MAKHSKFFHTKPKKERVILASVRINGNRPLWSHKESLIELGNLTSSVGGDVVCKISQNLKKPNHTYLGSGKLEELRDIKEFDTLICDDELTPTQQRNLESALNGKKVLDRTALILDVFATRARTSEGRLQVELAQNQYLLPRLQGQWTHLERLGGGIGTRGPGETQLETDRRLINQRIKNIKNRLNKSHKQREVNRYSRNKGNQTLVALVGYTNAGKTTLFNLLTESQLYAADKLFATLDSVTRKNSVTGLDDILFSDTVGFISNLPTELIESFKATLDELKSADLLVHVVDISDPDFIYKTEQVSLILRELGISDIPCIRVNNKSDKVEMEINNTKGSSADNEIWISALNNIGLNDLVNSIQLNRKKSMVKEWVELQPNQGKNRAKLYSLGRVLEETTSDTGLIQLQLEIDKKELGNLISDKDINLKKNNIKEAI